MEGQALDPVGRQKTLGVLRRQMLTGSNLFRHLPLRDVPLDSCSIPQNRLNIEDKVRSNLFPWNGQFSPQLVHAFLEAFGDAGGLVLDPFMGSGTVLVEAGAMGLRAFGTEINPAAFQMASAYRLINVRERKGILKDIEDDLVSTFTGESKSDSDPDVEQINLKRMLLCLRDKAASGHSQNILATLVVLLDFYKPNLTRQRIWTTWRKLRERLEALPNSRAVIDMANSDARQLPLKRSSVDLVITSPPYINVFNYHQQYRASAEALGWDLLHVARSEMGSNRKHRGNRFLTVIQYCLDITQAMLELRRVCKPTARIIIVVGRESNVLKTPFFNGAIVSTLGVRCAGLAIHGRQERVFKNKFGSMIYEDILHFTPANDEGILLDDPRDVAREVLNDALVRCPTASRKDLQDALDRVADVHPSPLYAPSCPR